MNKKQMVGVAASLLVPLLAVLPASASPIPPQRTSNSVHYIAQEQIEGYWCGPASTRVAFSVQDSTPPSQSTIAGWENTTTAGTSNISVVTAVLNAHGESGWYETKKITSYPTSSQVALLESDARIDIDNSHAIVAGVYGKAKDTAGKWHSYNDGHYLTVVGYKDSGAYLHIYDVANNTTYWMSALTVAVWIDHPYNGYSA